MIKLISEYFDENVKFEAKILLKQYNTAGGLKIKHELECILQKYGY
jgi:hypothetical protein